MRTNCLLIGLAVLGAPLAHGANFTVGMGDDFFSPSSLSIGKGDTVLWTNTTPTTTHTSTSGDPSACNPDGLWDSGNVAGHGKFSLTFTSTGTFPYFCSIHCTSGMVGSLTVTNSAAVPPSVTITNPADGATFRAPANVTIQATASSSSGTVTNVQLLVGAAVLANLRTPPYSAATNNLRAGNYTLSAIATDDSGLKATNSTAIFVQTSAALSAPMLGAERQFQFTINGIAGQTYIIEASSDTTVWIPMATNTAPANVFNFTNANSSNLPARFYRTRQD